MVSNDSSVPTFTRNYATANEGFRSMYLLCANGAKYPAALYRYVHYAEGRSIIVMSTNLW